MRNENRIKRLEERLSSRHSEVDNARRVIESMLGHGEGASERVEYAVGLVRKGSSVAEAIVEGIFYRPDAKKAS